MIAQCGITCGSWGQGLDAFDRLFNSLPEIAGAIALIGAVWFISACRR